MNGRSNFAGGMVFKRTVTMNELDRSDLLKLAVQRPLSSNELTRLRSLYGTEPDGMEAMELDLRVTQSISQLPNVPVSSNFTAQVLQRVERVEGGRRVKAGSGFWGVLMRWVRPITVGSALAFVGVVGYLQYRTSARVEFAESVATLSTAAAVPPLELLQNFEAINQLSQVPRDEDVELVDFELLAALQ